MTLADEEAVVGCEVCRSAQEVGMIPHVSDVLCRECASEAQNTLIVRARAVGMDNWDGPAAELARIVSNMKEARASV